MEFLNKIFIFIKQKKYIVVAALMLLVLIVVAISLLIVKNSAPVSQPNNVFPTEIFKTQGLKVLSTNPINGQTNVSNGEILISFTTNIPVVSQKMLSINFYPNIPYYWKYENSFPSTNIKIRIYGGLKPATKYFISVKDTSGSLKTQWSFSTSSKPAISSPLIGQQKTQQEIHDKFQLVPYVPYSNNDFYIDYAGDNVSDNTLEVDIQNPNISQDQVKQEVNAWIKSKGINPSTQKINYVNDF